MALNQTLLPRNQTNNNNGLLIKLLSSFGRLKKRDFISTLNASLSREHIREKYFSFTSSTTPKSKHKYYYGDNADSDPFYDNYGLLENFDETYTDLVNFLDYLKIRKNKSAYLSTRPTSTAATFKGGLNLTNDIQITFDKFDLFNDTIPVAIIQLFILFLVFLFFYLMCKCNHMLEACRNRLNSSKSPHDPDDLRYHDRKTLKDYCCFFWYEFKMRRRFKKRRIRNRRFGRNLNGGRRQKPITSNSIINSASFDHNKTIRRSNSILKRRSVMPRNRVYSTIRYSARNRDPNNNNNNKFSSLAQPNNNNESQQTSEITDNETANKSTTTTTNENNNTMLVSSISEGKEISDTGIKMNRPSARTIRQSESVSYAPSDQKLEYDVEDSTFMS